jgi:hypothetical protein
VPGQGRVAVLERGDGTGREVVQFDTSTVAAHRALRRDGVQRQSLRLARTVIAVHVRTALVVDDRQSAVVIVQTVDPAAYRQRARRRRDGALDPRSGAAPRRLRVDTV